MTGEGEKRISGGRDESVGNGSIELETLAAAFLTRVIELEGAEWVVDSWDTAFARTVMSKCPRSDVCGSIVLTNSQENILARSETDYG